eukprot:Nk52_evm55s207 gene=Nk52_evmTU55s207
MWLSQKAVSCVARFGHARNCSRRTSFLFYEPTNKCVSSSVTSSPIGLRRLLFASANVGSVKRFLHCSSTPCKGDGAKGATEVSMARNVFAYEFEAAVKKFDVRLPSPNAILEMITACRMTKDVKGATLLRRQFNSMLLRSVETKDFAASTALMAVQDKVYIEYFATLIRKECFFGCIVALKELLDLQQSLNDKGVELFVPHEMVLKLNDRNFRRPVSSLTKQSAVELLSRLLAAGVVVDDKVILRFVEQFELLEDIEKGTSFIDGTTRRILERALSVDKSDPYLCQILLETETNSNIRYFLSNYSLFLESSSCTFGAFWWDHSISSRYVTFWSHFSLSNAYREQESCRIDRVNHCIDEIMRKNILPSRKVVENVIKFCRATYNYGKLDMFLRYLEEKDYSLNGYQLEKIGKTQCDIRKAKMEMIDLTENKIAAQNILDFSIDKHMLKNCCYMPASFFSEIFSVCKDGDEFDYWFSKFRGTGFAPRAVHFDSFLFSLSKRQMFDECRTFFRKYDEYSVQAGARTFEILASAARSPRALSKEIEILGNGDGNTMSKRMLLALEIKKRDVYLGFVMRQLDSAGSEIAFSRRSAKVLRQMILSYGCCGRLDLAMKVYKRLGYIQKKIGDNSDERKRNMECLLRAASHTRYLHETGDFYLSSNVKVVWEQGALKPVENDVEECKSLGENSFELLLRKSGDVNEYGLMRSREVVFSTRKILSDCVGLLKAGKLNADEELIEAILPNCLITKEIILAKNLYVNYSDTFNAECVYHFNNLLFESGCRVEEFIGNPIKNADAWYLSALSKDGDNFGVALDYFNTHKDDFAVKESRRLAFDSIIEGLCKNGDIEIARNLLREYFLTEDPGNFVCSDACKRVCESDAVREDVVQLHNCLLFSHRHMARDWWKACYEDLIKQIERSAGYDD